jgi:hypothetical protein
MSVYKQLAAACLPLIEAYRDDLTRHDKASIEKDPELPFLHWTRSCGTTLVHLEPQDPLPKRGQRVPYLFGSADREHIVRQVAKVAELFCRENQPEPLTVHWFDGVKLRRISAKRALEVAHEYRRRLFDQWDSERKAVTYA